MPILMLHFYLCVGLPRGAILSGFPTNFFRLIHIVSLIHILLLWFDHLKW